MNLTHRLRLLLIALTVTGSPAETDTGTESDSTGNIEASPPVVTHRPSPTSGPSEQCVKPNVDKMILDPNKEHYNPGESVTVWCEAGYHSSSNSMKCEAREGSSDWNKSPSCIAQCNRPTGGGIYGISPVSGYNQEYYNRGNKVTVQCQTGYYSPYGTYTCRDKGSGGDWDRSVFCIAQCNRPTGGGIYSISPDSGTGYRRDDKVTVRCQTGYYSPYTTYTCKKKGSGSDWDQSEFCIEQCNRPSGEGIQSLSPDTTYYNPGQTVTVRCSDGYHPVSQQTTCPRREDRTDWTVTVPCVKIQVTGLSVTSTSISFLWGCEPVPCWTYWRFDVTCCLIRSNKKRTQCQNRNPNKGNVIFNKLLPFSEYEIRINGNHQNLTWRSLQTWTTWTKETAPGKPEIMKNPGENVIKWTLQDSRGNITGYEMNISAQRDYNESFSERESYQFPPNVTEFKLEMKDGTNYTVSLRGFTSAGAGEATEWHHETPITDPPVPLQKVLSMGVRTAELELHPVPDIHRPLSSYEVIVSVENSSDPCTGYTSTHYNSSSSPRPYTAALIPAHNLTRPTTLTLGDGKRYNGFFNAPLSVSQRYTVSVRVTSAWRGVEKSSCASNVSFTVSEPWKMPVAMMAGLAAAVFMLLILGLLLVLWKRGLLRPLGNKSFKRAAPGIPLKKQDGSGKKKNIPVENFLEIVKGFKTKELMAQEESEEEENGNMLPVGRYQEYKELPPGLLYPCDVATLEQNISKNRYKKVIPYDNSRVHLVSSSSGSDYINASYVHGYKARKYFIASQGPLPGTVADFWHMVWQENSSVIVMLTGLEENNKLKCECYWPEQRETYGDITVLLQTVKQSGAITARDFTLIKSGVQRKVEHFHYLQWPDHGVPSKLYGLLQVVEEMNRCHSPSSGPIIVHCSAGIGRTGTFMALDILLKMARAESKVNVFNCTLQLRKQRTNMVQNKEQYVFLYDIVLETLVCGVTSIAVDDIQKHIRSMGVRDPVTNINGYMKEFQNLQKLTGLYSLGSYREAEKPQNQARNRYHGILPGDHCRPILMSVNQQNSSGYINAVFINSNCLDDAFLVTQLPLKKTLPDFWSLVWDYKCSSVVLMHDDQEVSEMSAQFWPEKGETRYGDFIVKKISKVLATGYKEFTLCVRACSEFPDSSLEVKLFQLTLWPKNQAVPQNPSAFISLIGKIERRSQQLEDSHVLVTCCDGASRSGLFCTGAIVCDQIRSDGCLDVSQAVRSMKKRRIQLVPSPEQYAFCYSLAQGYLDSFETYGNFTQ